MPTSRGSSRAERPIREGKNSKKLVFLGNSLLNPASGGQEKIVHDP
jgi:hypothetical protein